MELLQELFSFNNGFRVFFEVGGKLVRPIVIQAKTTEEATEKMLNRQPKAKVVKVEPWKSRFAFKPGEKVIVAKPSDRMKRDTSDSAKAVAASIDPSDDKEVEGTIVKVNSDEDAEVKIPGSKLGVMNIALLDLTPIL